MKDARRKYRRPPGVILAVIAGGFMPVAIAAAPATLTDVVLDAVTAGTTGTGTPPADGKRPAVIVADGARYTLDRDQNVELRGRAQLGLRALNVIAAAGADVGNAVNLSAFDGGAGGALQRNVLSQRESRTGSLGRASLAGAQFRRGWSVESQFARSSSSSQVTGWQLQSRSRLRTVDQFAAFVPEYNPLQNLTLTVGTPALDPLRVPAFSFDFVEETDVGDFGIRGGAGPFTLGAPQLVLGSVSLDGDDLVLSSGFVQVPSLDLGNASLQVCIVACTSNVSVDLGGFTGPRLDLPGGDLRFEGANPFKDTRINAGHGIATVGAGSISVVPGRVTLASSLTLDLPDPSFSFDFTIPGIGEIGPWDVDGPDIDVEIPGVAVSHTLIDEPVGFAFSATFDGVLCLAVATTDCGSGSRRVEREESATATEIRLATASAFEERSRTTSGHADVHAGATLTDAEADLIAMSQASALIDSASSIALADSAQRGLRAMNAVNAADTIVGNALNATTAVRPAGAPASPVTSALVQTNVFVQHRTRYGL